MDGLRNGFRVLGLARSLARHDALSALERLDIAPGAVRLAKLVSGSRADACSANTLARALSEAGPGFAALGRLAGLFWDPLQLGARGAGDDPRSRPPPFAAHVARATIARELRQPVASLFSAFDDAPDTIGHLAQVHHARSADGRALAVKVLRPGVHGALMRDLALIRLLADRLARRRPEWRGLRIEDAIDGFAEALETEIDFRIEAAAATEIADNFAGDETFRLAGTDWERSTRRVLTRELVTGPRIGERDAILAAGFDSDQVLGNLIAAFFKQVLRDGAFVAEVSGETLRLAQDGAIVAADLGAVVRLTPGVRRNLGALLVGLVVRDFENAAQALLEAGWVPPHHERASTARTLERIAGAAAGGWGSFSHVIVRVFHDAELAILEGQPRLISFESALLAIERIAIAIAPQTPLWDTALPVIRSCLADIPAQSGRRIEHPRPVANGRAEGRRPGEAPARPPVDALRLYPKAIRRLRLDVEKNPFLPMMWIVFVVFFLTLALIL